MSLFSKQPKHVQSSDSARKLGRLPNDPSKPRLKLGKFLKGEYAGNVPASVDYVAQVSNWPMYGNDQLGDCTAAAAGHMEEAWSTYGQGKTVQVTDNDVIAFYSASSGYVPGDPSTDQGAVMQDCLDVWRKQGLAGHKIAAFFEIDIGDMQAVKAALYLFGGVYIGVNFPTSAMDQFNAGKPWEYSAKLDNTIEGGHCVHVGLDNAGDFVVSTWGALQHMTQNWWNQFVEEAWAPVTQEWINNNQSPEGLDVNALNAAFQSMTGEPGPFGQGPTPTPSPTPIPTPTPTPDPGPTPTPTPDPTPGPSPVDLVTCIKKCIDNWLAAKGRK